MAETDSPTFGTLLRSHRRDAGYTQEALAERAGLSVRGIQDLERGVTHPLKDTIRRLATALSLSAPELRVFTETGERVPRRPHGASAARTRAPHNLPTPMTSFVGHEDEIAEVVRLLNTSRLLMLIGSGGCGKTRVALQVAWMIVNNGISGARGAANSPGEGGDTPFKDGVWHVDIAPLADPALVPQTLASVLSIRESQDRTLTMEMLTALHQKHMLLVLDNCEHLVDACALLIATLLPCCPHVHVLGTSWQVLGVTGERVWRVRPLSVPPEPPTTLRRAAPLNSDDALLLSSYEAVRLFLDRATAIQPTFAFTPGQMHAVAHVCRRLDGIPLAIELAAARVDMLRVEQIAARLDDRFRLLTRGGRSAGTRHRTLRATLDWSFDLLGPRERAVFCRLAVFAGGWTLEAATAICADSEITGDEIEDVNSNLVDASLVVVEQQDGSTRYGLLETMRQYGWARLLADGGARAVGARHAVYYLALAEDIESQLLMPGEATGFAQLVRDQDNLRTALHWYAMAGAVDEVLRLASALQYYWVNRGFATEGQRWLDHGIGLRDTVSPRTRGRALRAAGFVSYARGEYSQADALLQSGLIMARQQDDRREEAWALAQLGRLARDQGLYSEALASFEEALTLSRSVGDQSLAVYLLLQLGIMAREQNDLARAQMLLKDVLVNGRDADNLIVAAALVNLAIVAQDRRDAASANVYLREGLGITYRMGNAYTLAFGLETAAGLAALACQPQRALHLASAAAALRDRIGMPTPPMWRLRIESMLERTRGALDAATAAAAWDEGQMLTLERAVAEAMDE